MAAILRIEDFSEADLHGRRIEGLNIFSANRVPLPPQQDPRLLFLQEVSQTFHCASHVGLLALEGDSPLEIFGASAPNFASRVGVYGGTFYGSHENPIGVFFPASSTPYLGASVSHYRYLLICGALALYIRETRDDPDQWLAPLQEAFVDEQAWLHKMTLLYSLVVVTMGDGDYLQIFTRDPVHFDLLVGPTERAARSIASSPWYNENLNRLRWDDESNLCLMIQS